MKGGKQISINIRMMNRTWLEERVRMYRYMLSEGKIVGFSGRGREGGGKVEKKST